MAGCKCQARGENVVDGERLQRGRAIGRCAGVGRGVDDLVPAPVERSPPIGAGRSKQDDAWRPRRGGDVRDAGVVRDQQIEGRDDRGELAEIGHAGEIDRGRVHRAAHRRRKRSLLIRSRQDDPRLTPFRQPVAESGERVRRPAPAGVGCADVEPDHRASIGRTDQRCRLGPFGRCHRKLEVQTSGRRANRLGEPQPAQRLRLTLDPAQRRRQPPFAGWTKADGVRRPRVPRRTRCSPPPTHASGMARSNRGQLRDRSRGAGGRLGDSWKTGERQEAIDRRQPRDETLPPRAGQ